MENSALNLAHEKQRRAEVLLREGKFEEAASCHEHVADLLTEAHTQLESNLICAHTSTLSSRETFLTSIQSLVSLESLSLQRDYHKRQAAVVRMKQAQYEEYKATLENQQKDFLSKQMAKHSEKDNTDVRLNKYDGSLRQAIYKTIDEQDSLLGLISIPSNDDKAFKHPKDTGTIIEELRTVNGQLRDLVGNLLSQLEAKEEEVRQLTERLYAVSVNPNNGIRSEEHPLRHAPLPPLEMPLFDFTSS
ncbi:PREDICTED: nuclear receptor-binding factor 2-like [Dinoponera quadriceps]|uniref:Nuclear receptor-binding factor 2-like n=1 Tax=Dinoponera quadriceps TaxID=609295 RepID=A0A6P3WPF6_DINQU|nr:PREDICTED: nuclear receptor-binding factor 2-like [Dinoponera quadriceps]XP_014468031.1 PREDICTED: nuclear receptor-binding factor 2-like [Dinoponera quadriceps]XP_014468032.1 PREDICTED: nuclear receptor-binding factor 2-like [Dinoponera quadriceps]XP_014468033.1 PREDICTED: nuclear receptor-binding factor 2-like [Dinoponera quadriceps]